MKQILLVAGLVLATVAAEAQFEIRPLAGFNFAQVTESPDGTTTEARAGFQIGGHILAGGKFHLYPGITYFKQVTEYTFRAEGTDEELVIDQEISGVKIPILVGYRFMDPDDDPFFNLRLFAGPAMNFLTKAEYSEDMVDEEVDWNDVTWGARVGAGLDIAFLFLDLGYEFGLTDVHDVSEAADSFKDTKHNTFIVNVGLKLTL